MAEIDVSGFTGANNLKAEERFFSAEGIAEPRIVLNSDVDVVGRLVGRQGRTLYVALSGAHSIWAGETCMLCVASGTLYRIAQGLATSVGTVSGPKHPFSYAEAEGKVYISNPYWQGVFDPATNAVSSWGVSLPPGPMLLSGAGNLPAGKYHVCMTNVSSGELSGNGPVSGITLSSTGGIQVLNRPAGALIWATDSDEYQFYLVGAVDTIVDVPTVEPLPSFMCCPPFYLEHLCYAFGRIWGASGSTLYYSQPFNLGWFRAASNVFTFDSAITLIAKAATGLFIGMEDHTRFLHGTEPDQMVQIDAGEGSIRGTLAYCNNLPDLESVLGTTEKGSVSVPIWTTTDGIVAGSNAGTLYNLTKNKIKFGIPDRGASLYRNMEGTFQFLTSFRQGATGSGKGFADADTLTAFRNGRIATYNKNLEDTTNRVAFGDSVAATVTRGGVVI